MARPSLHLLCIGLLGVGLLGFDLLGCGPAQPQVRCPEVEVAGDDASTTKDLPSWFFPLLADQQMRGELWALYGEAEPAARRFALDGWTEVRLVIASDRALWWDHGLIEIPVAADDQGALAHELFHGAYHHSPLNAGDDAPWGEAFADAFRYLIERQRLDGEASPWLREMDRLAALTAEERAVARRDDEVFRAYGYPALLILERAEWSLERFETLWIELNDRRRAAGHDILDQDLGDALTEAK